MTTIFYLYDCISFNDLTISNHHTGCKLISHVKENKQMMAMLLVLCQAMRIWGLYLSFSGGVSSPLHHGGIFALKGSTPFSWGVRGTSSTKFTVTECVKRVMVVYNRGFDFFYVLICCFTSTVSSWCHAGAVSYLITMFLGKSPIGS